MSVLFVDHSFRSDNHSERGNHVVSLVLLHATVGSLRSSLKWLCNPASEVSTHYVIAKSGAIYQLVLEEKCAWHAGKAIWRGETKVNEISIGIELENMTGVKGFKGQDPYPDTQIHALTDLVHNILPRYTLTPDNIARHLDVATPPGRKTDPIGFPYDAWRNALMTPTPPPTAPPAMPLPIVQSYRVLGTPIFQRQDLTGPVVGYLQPGEVVQVDMAYDNGAFHLKDGRGFAALSNVQGPL